jgi:hypothetical protein
MRAGIAVGLASLWFCLQGAAEESSSPGLGAKWTVLYQKSGKSREVAPISMDMVVQPVESLAFTGPQPGHPFVLGKYEVNGEWGVTGDGINLVRGTNAALRLVETADEFELEGTMTQNGPGGWYLLFGWNEGRGYALSNVNMVKSGSPWFLSELVDGKALENQTMEFPKFEWKGNQPFKLTIKERKATFTVGKTKIFTDRAVDSYEPGAVILGTYDTKLGPRKLQLHAVRARSLAEESAKK